MGSIGGGGRYDDLTGLFGVPNIPGVGISFGVDRIYDVLEELNLFPAECTGKYKGSLSLIWEKLKAILLLALCSNYAAVALPVNCITKQAKINKQFTYAEKKNIPFVIIIGSKEMEEKNCAVKNLATGKQEIVSL